jgi:hypothetical protein
VTDDTGLVEGATVKVVRGRATAEEAVAVLLALDLARAADADGSGRQEPGNWRRAPRLEAASRIRLGPLHELRAASR